MMNTCLYEIKAECLNIENSIFVQNKTRDVYAQCISTMHI